MNSIQEIIEAKMDPMYSFAENYIATELKLQGSNFARQYPIGPYFADFYFPETKTVLEVDGKEFHNSKEQVEHDDKRDRFMNKLGYNVIRVSGHLAKINPSGVVDSLRLFPKSKGRTFILEDERSLIYLQQLSVGIIPA